MQKISIFLLILALFIVSCRRGEEQPEDALSGRVLIWHTWHGAEQETLVRLLDDFMELNPGVTLLEESFPIETMTEDFINQARSGYGPDIIIAPAELSHTLAQQELVHELHTEDLDTDIYLSNALGVLQDGEDLYGIPLSLSTLTLYYNKALLGDVEAVASVEETLALIEQQQQVISDTETLAMLDNLSAQIQPQEGEALEPATTLDELIRHADQGHQVALRSDFYGAFWGVQTFGGQLFDEEDRVVLNQGGFANWLDWMRQAKLNPHIVLNRRQAVLQEQFILGEATYYVGDSQELTDIQAELGVDVVGVSRLPGRFNKPAGPFLEVEAIMFNRAASQQNIDIGLHLAHYLTNVEQQLELAFSVGRLPVNRHAEIDPRVSATMAELVAQTRTAVPIRLGNIEKLNDLIAMGDVTYTLVLDGEMSVGEAAAQLTSEINTTYGLDTLVTEAVDCDVSGRITLQHTWQDEAEEALVELVEQFIQTCPTAIVQLERVEAVELYEDMVDPAGSNQPQLILGSNRWLVDFADAGTIQNISRALGTEFTQRYLPGVEQSAIYQNNFYAIPATLDVFALYVNNSLVQDPPAIFDNLTLVLDDTTRLGIPTGFYESYWGIAPFHDRTDRALFDDEGRLILGELGLADWLTWLQDAQTQPNFVLSSDQTLLQDLFINEELAYLAGESSQLTYLQTELGTDKLDVVHLPSGEPLLLVDMFMVNAQATEEEQALAILFAQYAASLEGQEMLLQIANKIPTNVNVDTSAYPAVTGFLAQVESAVSIPNLLEMNAVFDWGDLTYEQVLQNGIDPLEEVANFTNVVNVTNGFEVVVVEEELDPAGCEDTGQITLWHSWTDLEAIAWEQVISDYAQLCAGVEVNAVFIPAADFTSQLTLTLTADNPQTSPDLFITGHNNLEFYEAAGLVTDLSPFVDDALLIDYQPRTITALSLDTTVYGLPQSVEVQALYYQPNLVTDPATTFDDLRLQATAGLTVGLTADFANLFWGAAAFGCQPCQTGALFDDQGELALTPADFADWLTWLAEAQADGNVIISTDKAALEELFIAGELAYLIDSSGALTRFQEELGVANVALAPLPTGENNAPSVPFEQINGFMFHREATETQTTLAFHFAEFATGRVSQIFLMEAVNYVPANNLAAIAVDDPAILILLDMLENSVLLPSSSQWAMLMQNSPIYTIFQQLVIES